MSVSKPATKRRSKAHTQLINQLKANGLPQPVEELRFAQCFGRQFRLDLAWPEYRLAVEVHGGVFTRGRHVSPTGFTEDRVKMNYAQLLGWRVLEVTSAHVQQRLALTWIAHALSHRYEKADLTWVPPTKGARRQEKKTTGSKG